MYSEPIAGVSDVVATFGWCEEGERSGDERVHLVECARSCGAEKRFQFRERLFDGIEIGTVRRQEPQGRPHARNRGVDVRLPVRREIVEYDDVARLQGRHKHLLDVGEKAAVIDRPIKHRRRGQACGSERGDDSVGLPVAGGRVIRQPTAAQTAAIPAEQIRGDAALIHEDPLADVAQGQPGAPVAALRRDVGPSLFVGVNRFF